MKATAHAVIDRPIEAVWDIVATVENMEQWVGGVSDVRPPADGLDVGAHFSSNYTYRGETFDVDYEVTAVDPPHRLDVRSTEGPFPFSGSIRLVEVRAGTAVSNTIDAGSDSVATSVIFAVFGPLIRRMMRRQLEAELGHLAEAVDETVGAAGPLPLVQGLIPQSAGHRSSAARGRRQG